MIDHNTLIILLTHKKSEKRNAITALEQEIEMLDSSIRLLEIYAKQLNEQEKDLELLEELRNRDWRGEDQ